MRHEPVPATRVADLDFFSGVVTALALSVPFWFAVVALLR